MEVKNKMESVKKINELNLNKFPERVFKKGEEMHICKFLEKYPATYYAIRENLGHYFITIDDDLINSRCVSKVLDLGGQYIHIDNMLNTTGWYDFERYEYIRNTFI